MKKLTSLLRRCVLSPQILYIWTLVVLIVPNVALCITEDLPLWAALTNLFLPLGFYALILALGRTTGKMVWWLFLALFFAAFQIVLLFLFGNSIIGVDMFLNVLTTNPSEAFEVLGNLLSGIATIVLLYVPILVVACIQIYHHKTLPLALRRKLRIGAIILLLCGAGSLVGAYRTISSYKVLNDLYPLNVCYNVKLTADRLLATNRYHKASADFTFHTSPTHPDDVPEVYVLVIGETARADNFGLYGYHRPTTPRLQADTAQIVWFTDVLSQSNTTHKSVPMLLSAATAQDFNRIYSEKSIITAFKEAGFYTAYLSNQRRNHSFIDFYGEEADKVVFLKDDARTDHYDTELLTQTEALLQEGHRKLFVVLHLYGSHFNYRERYKPADAQFGPDIASEARPENRESLLNAYDNTILMTDLVLDSLFHQVGTTEALSAVFYTSDHGENIYDDARHLFLHASPRPSYYDMHVPLIIYTSPSFQNTYPEQLQALIDNQHKPVAPNASAFHTMLYLAGLQTPALCDSLALSSPHYACPHRYYINDHNEPIPLRQLKLSDEDFQQFKIHKITLK
ncbi:MAG: lipid A phosphoethanolamine transferase [Alloprevotella sp.]|nr:lipid A phosphoethanolamine transferase [Alloprevotella sp.]